MSLHNKIISLALGGSTLIGMADAALAAPAVATTNVNVAPGRVAVVPPSIRCAAMKWWK